MPHTLVTGANSFVAAHIINELIANGHTVTGTVRRTSAGEALFEGHPEWKEKLDFVVIEDYAKEGAFDSVFQKQQFDYIVHIAAPLLDNPEHTDYDTHFLKPSNASTEYTNETWSNITPEQAREMQNAYISYCSSKKEAELSVWEFVKTEKPKFAVTVFLPALIFGPPLQSLKDLNHLNFSTNVFYKLFNGTYDEIPNTHDGLFPSYIDVRDLATAHVRALTTPGAANKRFLIGGQPLSTSGIVKTLAALAEKGILPELNDRLPKDTGKDNNITPARIRAEEANELLGMKLRSAEETFGDVAKKILELEKEGK
ncbi:NAD(P)-binding protein [Lindgomyces ingoldianus]|uniref:NAD(P)-binding protein n=1 Tax=Lindgomyces ingoldianus TaxID=673940 RepID=A0ACB6QKF3_9PLEO|nr:NAD(P)-binding protein [Lindgomyces ingoldianus]KAF2467418.1 NAD(P)-binding protein [Lindgomyces ingoldianus]